MCRHFRFLLVANHFPVPRVSPAPDGEYIGGRRVFVLDAPYRVKLPGFEPITVPPWFRSDLSSVPRWLSPFISHDDVGFMEAGLVHDFLYHNGKLPRATCDFVFREILRACGVPLWKRWLAWASLRCAGKRHYKGRTTKREKWPPLALACLLILCGVARAETHLLIFTDPPNCVYCRQFEKTLDEIGDYVPAGQDEFHITSFKPPFAAPLGITVIPTIVAIDGERDERGEFRELRRHVGYLDAKGLRKFVEGK